jgi:hypothetical protein
MARESDGWDIPLAAAALVKLPFSQTARKYFTVFTFKVLPPSLAVSRPGPAFYFEPSDARHVVEHLAAPLSPMT